MKKIIFVFILTISSFAVNAQDYGVLFVHGLGDNKDLFKTYDNTSLEADLKVILGTGTVFKYLDFSLNSSVAERAAEINGQLTPAEKTKKWFIVGHSMGGLIGRYYMKYYNTGSGVNVKGLITLNSPHLGTQTLSSGKEETLYKWNTYYSNLMKGPSGDNPWLFGDQVDIFVPGPGSTPLGYSIGVSTVTSYFNSMNTTVTGKLNAHFDNIQSRRDIKSLQKGSSDLVKLNTGTENFKMRVIAAEELQFSSLRLAGGSPGYALNKPENYSFAIFSVNPMDLGGAFIGQSGFNSHFEYGPHHAVASILAVRGFFSNRADAYLASENRFNLEWIASKLLTFGYGIGEFKYQRDKAAAAKTRYRFSRTKLDEFDYNSQDVVNELDVNYTYETITLIDDQWMDECGDEYFGGGDLNRPDMVPKYENLPSILPANYCSSPIYYNVTYKIAHYSSRANDGAVSVANQTPPAGMGSFFLAPKEPNEGYSHASSLWNYRPWSGQETATMRQAKQYIRDNKN